MSTLKVTNIENPSTTSGGIDIDTSGHVTVDGVAMPSSGPLSNRNRIINGDMRIDQRNAGASVTPNNSHTLDRWKGTTSQTSKYTVQQSTTAPAGFSNSLLVTSSSAYSITTSDYFAIGQSIEGFNIADLDWGKASAKAITISFKVRSSLTGTFGGVVRNGSFNRSYPFTYTISAANTFEDKTVTIPGDTTGTWSTDNSTGIELLFGLGVGSTYSGTAGSWAGTNYLGATGATSVVGTNGATFYITGVQLEVGSVATPFERRSYGQELSLCQRYLPFIQGGSGYICTGYAQSATQANLFYPFAVRPRVAPTGITAVTVTGFGATSQASGGAASSITFNNASLHGCNFSLNTSTTSYVVNAALFMTSNNAASSIQFTGCEL